MIIIVPFEAEVKSMEIEMEYYVKNQQYEKATEIRDKLNAFIAKGKDAEYEIKSTVHSIKR